MRTRYLDLFDAGCGPEGLEAEGLDERIETQRRALWGLLDDPAFVGCLATMNPDSLHQLRREDAKGRGEKPRTRNAQRRERLLYRFLSRFVGRNDVTGLAGTSFWGVFAPEAPESLRVSLPSTSPLKLRLVYASPAHLAHLERGVRASSTPRARRPQLAARLRLTPTDVVDTATGAGFALRPADRDLLGRCDGSTAWGDLIGQGPDVEASLARLAREGLVELDPYAPPLVPMDRGLATVVERLSALPELASSSELRAKLGELLDMERALRACAPAELAELERAAEALAGELTAYRPLDPAGSLRRLLKRMVEDPACHPRLALQTSKRFEDRGQDVEDAFTGRTLSVSATKRRLLDVFAGGATIRDAAAATGHESDEETFVALLELVEKCVLCPTGADPWNLRAPSRSDVSWDPWEKAWFERTLEVLEDMALPAGYRTALGYLASCRIVEQKSYEAIFPSLSPVVATDLAWSAFADVGAEPTPGRKDHSFFLVDSLLRDASLAVGGPLHRDIERSLAPFMALLGVRAWEWETRLLLPGLERMIPPGGTLPLAAALRGVSRLVKEWSGPFQGEGAPVLDAEHDAERHVLYIRGVRYPEAYEGWVADKRLVSSVDVMIAGSARSIRNGRWRLVVNEAHSSGDGMPETMHVPWTGHVPEQGFTTSHVEEIFGADLLALQPLLPTKQAQSIAWQLRGAALAVRNLGSGIAWDGPRVRVADLALERTPDGFAVTDGERRFGLLHVDLATGFIRGVRYSPRTLAGRLTRLADVREASVDEGIGVLPEIRLNGLTICRRMYTIPPVVLHRRLDGKEGRALLAEAGALRRELSLPRLVFVSLFQEKAFLCDFESLFSLEVLAHALRDNAWEVVITEMDPAPEDLWLEVAGAPVACELRFMASLTGGAFDPSRSPVLTGSPA